MEEVKVTEVKEVPESRVKKYLGNILIGVSCFSAGLITGLFIRKF